MGLETMPSKTKSVQKLTKVSTSTSEAVMPIINQMLQLYSKLSLEDAWQSWNKVMEDQTNCSSWTDMYEL